MRAADDDSGGFAAAQSPGPRTTLCDVVHFVATNGFAQEVVRCVRVCKNMRTHADLWERVVDVLHCEFRQGAFRITRLILWAKVGDVLCTLETLGHGAKINARDTNGWTALYWASERGHLAVVRELLARGADVDARYSDAMTTLMRVSRYTHTSVVVELVARKPGVDARTPNGLAPLMLACFPGHAAAAAVLLRLGADVNAQACDGGSALIRAATFGHIDADRMLLSAPGVGLNFATADGSTALSHARARGDAAIVALLEAVGAR